MGGFDSHQVMQQEPVAGASALQYFAFEADFVSSLRCIPMVVRFKLDLCGIKLSLRAWGQFHQLTRVRLASMPTTSPAEITAYGDMLCRAIVQVGEQPVRLAVDPQPAWMDTQQVPQAVLDKAAEVQVLAQAFAPWPGLTPLQRFALLKLTRGGHENQNFLPALREFGLLVAAQKT